MCECSNLLDTHILSSCTAFTVGFEQTEYTFREDAGGEVCVVLEEGGIQGDQSVELTLGASDGTATGMQTLNCITIGCIYNIVFRLYLKR